MSNGRGPIQATLPQGRGSEDKIIIRPRWQTVRNYRCFDFDAQ